MVTDATQSLNLLTKLVAEGGDERIFAPAVAIRRQHLPNPGTGDANASATSVWLGQRLGRLVFPGP